MKKIVTEMKLKKNIIAVLIILIVNVIIILNISNPIWAKEMGIQTTSEVKFFPISKIEGRGPLPYNYRIIDGRIHAGGYPLNPHYTNSDSETLKILNYLKSNGVKTVITLDGRRSAERRLKPLLKKVGLTQLFIPMHSEKVPDKEETKEIFKAIEKGGVYIHCTWGADRTGSIIAKYLIKYHNYTPYKAYRAVINGGSHSGKLGGLKRGKSYKNLILYFWPTVKKDSPKIAEKYGIN